MEEACATLSSSSAAVDIQPAAVRVVRRELDPGSVTAVVSGRIGPNCIVGLSISNSRTGHENDCVGLRQTVLVLLSVTMLLLSVAVVLLQHNLVFVSVATHTIMTEASMTNAVLVVHV